MIEIVRFVGYWHYHLAIPLAIVGIILIPNLPRMIGVSLPDPDRGAFTILSTIVMVFTTVVVAGISLAKEAEGVPPLPHMYLLPGGLVLLWVSIVLSEAIYYLRAGSND